MEQKIENTVDNTLEYVSRYLYTGSVILGAVLILAGVLFMIRKRKIVNPISIVCLALGVTAIISGRFQMP